MVGTPAPDRGAVLAPELVAASRMISSVATLPLTLVLNCAGPLNAAARPAGHARSHAIKLAESGKVVNIKKGQFLSPEAMQHAVVKVQESGNSRVWLTERGTMLGYQDMVVDMRGFPVMASMAPVIADITHSLQQPNQSSGVTGGRPGLIATIGKAAVAAGANGVFIETHPRPGEALSDGANMLPLDQLKDLLTQLKRVHAAVQVD